MRIALVEPFLRNTVGHYYSFLKEVKAGFEAAGDSVQLYLPNDAETDLQGERILPSQYRYIEGKSYLTKVWDIVSKIVRYRNIFSKIAQKTDAVFITTANSYHILAALSLSKLRCPIFLYFHTLELSQTRLARLCRAILNWRFNGANRVFLIAPFELDPQEIRDKITRAPVSFYSHVPYPLPFFTSFRKRPEVATSPAFCLGYFGDARLEKNFPRIVDFALEMQKKYSFIIQCHPPVTGVYENGVRKVVEKLKRTATERIIALDIPLSEPQYLEFLNKVSAVLCLYDPIQYKRRVSGILLEAWCHGKPVIVLRGSWLAEQVEKLGGGIVIENTETESLEKAVEKIRMNYQRYVEQAMRAGLSLSEKNNGMALAMFIRTKLLQHLLKSHDS